MDAAEKAKAEAEEAALKAAAAKAATEAAAKEAAAAEKERKAAEKAAAAAAIRGRKDSVPKGSTDLWPLLNLETPDLVAKIVAGECDGVLSELGEMAEAHPTHGPRGQVVTRQTVIDAVKARLRKA